MTELKSIINYQVLKDNNIAKNKYIKTDTNSKITDLSSISNSDKEIFNKLNYKLFKVNENRKKNINNFFPFNKEDLFSNIIIKNFNKKITKNIKEHKSLSKLNNSKTTFQKTINLFNNNKNNIRIIQNKINKLYYYSPKNILPKMANFKSAKSNSLEKESSYINKRNKDNKISLCLVPLAHLYKHESNQFNNMKQSILSNIYKNNIDKIRKANNQTFSKTSSSYYKNRIKTEYITNSKIKKNFLVSKEEKEEEENDMEPKIRFMNLRKELIQEKLKINKMFCDFNKQISDKKNLIRYIGRYRDRNNLMKQDILINNF